MIDEDSHRNLPGSNVIGQDGVKIGTVADVFVDDQTGRPEWVTVHTGLFGMRERFLPLQKAQVQGDDLLVPYGKDMVKDAPDVDVDQGHLSEDEEAELFRYYGIQYSSARRPFAVTGTGTVAPADFPTTGGSPTAESALGGIATGHDDAAEATGSGYGDWGVQRADPGSPATEAASPRPHTIVGTEPVRDYAGEATGSGYGAWGVGAATPGSPDSVTSTSGEESVQPRRGRLRRYSGQDADPNKTL